MGDLYCRYTDALFSPAEVEEMTGISPDVQRSWRKRGIIKQRQHGRAQFSAREVGQIFLLRFLGRDNKFDLETVREAAEDAGACILWFALGEKDHQRFDIQGSAEQKRLFKRVIAEEDRIGLHYLDKAVGIRHDKLARFLVVFPSSKSSTLENDLDELFGAQYPTGIVVDLMAIGKMFSDAARRPLIHVDEIEVRP